MKCGLMILIMAAVMASLEAQPKNPNDILLETTIIPEVSFKETSLSAVLEYFSKKVSEKKPLNFVPLYPPEYGEKLITLKLSNVPLKVVFDYVGQLTDVVFIPDRYAVRVMDLKAFSETTAPLKEVKADEP